MSSTPTEVMKITGYKDSSYNKNKMIGEYLTLINPESYSISHDININQKGAQGDFVPTNSHNKGEPQIINFKILFDGTGIIKKGGAGGVPGLAILGGNKPIDVAEDIAQFKKVVYNYDSGTHQIPFVLLMWGKLSYKCRLTKMSINFKLFKPDGTPLRAEADCSFTGSIDEKSLELLKNKKSPDLTHTITVVAGDTLPLLCYREYGDSKYYYQVARFNNLIDIKQIAPGMKLLFPPIINQ